MLAVRLFNWCRNQLFGQPPAKQRYEQTVLAWHIPDEFLRRGRRC